MAEIIGWVKANWLEISAAYTALVTFGSIVVRLTPTLKDDNVFLGVVKFISKYIALNTPTPTDRPK